YLDVSDIELVFFIMESLCGRGRRSPRTCSVHNRQESPPPPPSGRYPPLASVRDVRETGAHAERDDRCLCSRTLAIPFNDRRIPLLRVSRRLGRSDFVRVSCNGPETSESGHGIFTLNGLRGLRVFRSSPTIEVW
ncbi:Hypothetical predicted protein, partial [Marmota monax]